MKYQNLYWYVWDLQMSNWEHYKTTTVAVWSDFLNLDLEYKLVGDSV